MWKTQCFQILEIFLFLEQKLDDKKYTIMNFFQHVASRNDRKRHASTNWIFIASNEHFMRSAYLLTVIHLTYANHRLPRHIETSYFFMRRFSRLKIIPSKRLVENVRATRKIGHRLRLKFLWLSLQTRLD